jgi:hypothetical protein
MNFALRLLINMLNYQKTNNIVGWFVFAIATLVYVLTMEPTASFWDCGEFIAAAYKLQVPHPPGAPLFLLVGRIFSMFTTDVTQIAFMVNLVSVFSSSFTVLFLFWTITMMVKKVLIKESGILTKGQTISIMGAGLIGSLAFTFTDSFWFSATEAEVYAMSSLFTALVFWAILKWENNAEESNSDKWIILIAYLVGLSIGVHLLNLVTLPALGFVYYFKRYKPTTMGAIVTFLISAGIIGFIMVGVIPGLPSIAGSFEIFFVNSIGLPFNSGITIFIVLFIGALIYGLIYSVKHQKQLLNLILLSFTFILIGYASYGMILIRSNFDPPIDENDPENVLSFVSYLKREQYGDRPLVSGHYFTAGYPISSQKAKPQYQRNIEKGTYDIYDYKMDYTYDPAHIGLFPRAYSVQPGHKDAYINYMGEPKVPVMNADGTPGKKPSMGQNLKYFFTYQIGHMYIRYFLWNFMSRESDIQNASFISPSEWFATDLPQEVRENKGRNNFYMLPLILGLLGLFFHYAKDKLDWTIILLLFFFGGIAIIIYLNQPPIEPRERDYTYTGSFYAFCIWIGFGVVAISEFLRKFIASDTLRPVIATTVSLLVPGIMAAEGWNDHNRSDRYHSIDSAKNLLNSCAPNAILFTGGDNDTFPLWYVQEVEGFRTDVRVCNLSLLNTDWYISQMQKKMYDSEPLPISLEMNNYISGTNDQVFIVEDPKYNGGIKLDLYIDAVRSGASSVKRAAGSGDMYTILPSKTLFFSQDKEELAKKDWVADSLVNQIPERFQWTLAKGMLDKKDLIMLDMLVNNNWERPIYFSTTLSTSDYMNLKDYTQLEGLAHRLMPFKVPGSSGGWVNTSVMKDNMMNNFFFREANNPNVYYDENYQRFFVNARSQYHRLAVALYTEGKEKEAKDVLMYSLNVMPDTSIKYDLAIPPYIPLLLELDEKERAKDIAQKMGERSIENLAYFEKKGNYSSRDVEINLYILDQLYRSLREYGEKDLAARYESELRKYAGRLNYR